MSELSCDTPFIGQNETHDLSRYFDKNRAPLLKTYTVYDGYGSDRASHFGK